MARKPIARITPSGARRVFAMLAGEVAKAGNNVAASIPGEVSSGVIHETNEDGRPVALVAITEVNGLAIQAKRGTLTRAAASQGLDVTRYPR